AHGPLRCTEPRRHSSRRALPDHCKRPARVTLASVAPGENSESSAERGRVSAVGLGNKSRRQAGIGFLSIAPRLVADIFEAIARIAEAGPTILLVEQNTRLALEYSTRAGDARGRPTLQQRRGKLGSRMGRTCAVCARLLA